MTILLSKKYKSFIKRVNSDYPDVSEHMKTVLNTLMKYQVYIFNFFSFPNSDGILGETNSLSEVIKRIFYRNCDNFKTCVLFITNLLL